MLCYSAYVQYDFSSFDVIDLLYTSTDVMGRFQQRGFGLLLTIKRVVFFLFMRFGGLEYRDTVMEKSLTKCYAKSVGTLL